MNVSLIIPTYNRDELLVACLRCALVQDMDSYEIIVVDQTADHQPATRQFLTENGHRFTYILNDIPSAQLARNTGVARATGAVLVVIDDDTTFGPDFLRSHYESIQGGLDVVQGRIQEPGVPPGDRPTWMNGYMKVLGTDDCPTDGPTNNLTGANFSFSRRVIDTIGRFDERFHGPVLDDGDFARRAWRAGFRMGYVARASVYHHVSQQGGHGSSKGIFFNKAYHRCNLLFARKHFPVWVRRYVKIRLFWRGVKNLRKLIQEADQEAIALLAGEMKPF